LDTTINPIRVSLVLLTVTLSSTYGSSLRAATWPCTNKKKQPRDRQNVSIRLIYAYLFSIH